MSEDKRIYGGLPESECDTRVNGADSEERLYPDFIKEAQAAYQLKGDLALGRLLTKRQGEYTTEDYYALPEDCRVELIDGVIYNMAAPSWRHQNIAGEIFYYLKDYIRRNNGKCLASMSPVDVQLDKDDKTMIQPDVFVVCKKKNTDSEREERKAEKRKKESRKYEEHYAFQGAPDFVAEVLSPSSEKRDRIIKYRKYKNAGVREYWIVDSRAEIVTVHKLDSEETTVYTYQDKIPVHIFDGDCQISLENILQSENLLAEIGML